MISAIRQNKKHTHLCMLQTVDKASLLRGFAIVRTAFLV